MVTFGCSANFTVTITPEEGQETIDEIPVNIVQQSVPDENLGDEIVHGDESVSRYARANKNKCKCAGVFDHQELSTNTTISVVRALGLSVRSVQRGTSRHERHDGGTTNGKLVVDTISTCRERNRMDRIKKGERKRERVVDGK